MDWDLTMNLYLSTAMAMLVREDMYTVTHGKVFTNLGIFVLVVVVEWRVENIITNWPYFGVKLICVCLMSVMERKRVT